MQDRFLQLRATLPTDPRQRNSCSQAKVLRDDAAHRAHPEPCSVLRGAGNALHLRGRGLTLSDRMNSRQETS